MHGSYVKYRCVNFYSAEWGDIYPLPDYVLDGDDEEKPVEAEAVDAETAEVVAEAVVVQDTETGKRKPKGKGGSETVIDLSKPEVQDAEMVDEKD